jgi:DNA-binding MarR family transcriptional regulator
VSQRLERLEQVGLIERTVQAGDRRSIDVRLAAAGLQALDELIEEYVVHEEHLLAALTAKERSQLAALLVRLHGSITSTDD